MKHGKPSTPKEGKPTLEAMKRRRRKLALVPSAVFGTVFAGVVPAVVTGSAGCSSDDSSQKPDAQYYGVGAPCCSVAAVFDAGPDRRDGTATDAPEDTTVDQATDAPEAG
jgi:hypothetical protein